MEIKLAQNSSVEILNSSGNSIVTVNEDGSITGLPATPTIYETEDIAEIDEDTLEQLKLGDIVNDVYYTWTVSYIDARAKVMISISDDGFIYVYGYVKETDEWELSFNNEYDLNSIGDTGTKLYKHTIKNTTNSIEIDIISTSNTSYTAWPIMSSPIPIISMHLPDGTTVLSLFADSSDNYTEKAFVVQHGAASMSSIFTTYSLGTFASDTVTPL